MESQTKETNQALVNIAYEIQWRDNKILQLQEQIEMMGATSHFYSFEYAGKSCFVSVKTESDMKAFLQHLKLVENEAYKRGREEAHVVSQPVESTRLPSEWVQDLKRAYELGAGVGTIVEKVDKRFRSLDKRVQDLEKRELARGTPTATPNEDRMHESQG